MLVQYENIQTSPDSNGPQNHSIHPLPGVLDSWVVLTEVKHLSLIKVTLHLLSERTTSECIVYSQISVKGLWSLQTVRKSILKSSTIIDIFDPLHFCFFLDVCAFLGFV
jgi:hypothetical protein